MNLEDLGAIGEFVAAIATLVTLLYLAVQIRQNTRAVRTAWFQQVVDSFSEISLELGLNAEISEIFARADVDISSLDAVDRRRHQYILSSFFRRAESVFFQSDQRTLETEDWERVRESVKTMLRSPGTRCFWDENRSRFNSRFGISVESKLLDGPGAGLPDDG